VGGGLPAGGHPGPAKRGAGNPPAHRRVEELRRDMDAKIEDLRRDMDVRFRWTLATMVAVGALILAALKLLP